MAPKALLEESRKTTAQSGPAAAPAPNGDKPTEHRLVVRIDEYWMRHIAVQSADRRQKLKPLVLEALRLLIGDPPAHYYPPPKGRLPRG